MELSFWQSPTFHLKSMIADAWGLMEAELDKWTSLEDSPTLWWRDDDAATETTKLHRLVQMTLRTGVSPVVGAIPAQADESLGRALGGGTLSVVQHGVNHVNRAAVNEKKSEFPEKLNVLDCMQEIVGAQSDLDKLLCEWGLAPLLPIFVPPWNRLGDGLARGLMQSFDAVSGFGDRDCPGVRWINVHVDIIDWRKTRRFIGTSRAVEALLGHLQARRLGKVPRNMPTGLLTHHLIQDECAWRFLDTLCEWVAEHPPIRWLSGAEVLLS